jgi:hypothetical protein
MRAQRSWTALAAVIVAAGIGAFVLLDLIFANQMTPARATDLLEKEAPMLVSVLREDFSTDFSRIVKAAVESESELTDRNDIARFLDHQVRPITAHFGDLAREAPPELIVAWMDKLADAIDEVYAVAGPALCSRFVSEGKSVLTDPDMLAKLAPAFDARDAAFFTALAGARDTPVAEKVGEASDEDWQVVAAAMNGFEVPAGYAQIVATGNTASPDFCPALIYYFRIVKDLPNEAGNRIRAEYFVRSYD